MHLCPSAQKHRPLTLVLALLALAAAAHAQAPDLLLTHGHIYTGDPAHPWVDSLAITGDHITANLTPGPHTQVIDLHGRMAMPGINDAHDHVGGAPFGVEFHTKTPPPANPSLAEITTAIQTAALTAKPGEWIHGTIGRDPIVHPKETRAALDLAAPNNPVMLESWNGHGLVFNSAGLKKIGIDDSVKDIPGGRYDRDTDGHLTGLLEENTGNAIRLRLSSEPGVTPAELADLRAYAQRRLKQGVTSVQVMGSNQKLSDLGKAFVQADTPLRIRIMRFPFPAEDARLGEHLGSGEVILSPLVRVAGVKWVLDGTPLDGELAWQTKDYADRPGWRGRPNFPVDFLDTQLKLALTGKDQLLLHVVGDAMSDQVLDEMEKLAPAAQWQPLRVRFEHADGLTTPERDARARALGIVVAQPRPGRPWKALEAAGIPLAYGSDSGMAPWFMFGIMTQPGNPQAIGREQALAILTSGPAFAEFQEKRKGTLAPGMLADLAVLSQDVTTAPPPTLAATHSVLTIIGGKLAYTSPELEGMATPSASTNHE
jgi:predicted amidohydrolase YtcJ